jgi:hypothetical protein
MNKDIYESYINSEGKTWEKDNAYRLMRSLALFNQAIPHENPEVNKFWKYVRYNLLDPQDVVCSKFGKCPECGEEGILNEIGLDWACEKPECEQAIRDWYKNHFKNQK